MNILQELLKLNVKQKKGTGLKVLTPKQILQRLPIVIAHKKAGNNSESLLNEIRQIVYTWINCQMDHIQYQIFKIILNIFLKNIMKMLIIHKSEYK